MLTTNAPLTLDDIGLLIEGLTAAASAHRGPKTALALKKEAKRNQLTTELQALQSELLAEMGIVIPPAAPAVSGGGKLTLKGKGDKGAAAAAAT